MVQSARNTHLRHCLHGRGFICNRIGFDAGNKFAFRLHADGRVLYQNRVVFNTFSKVERFENDAVLSRVNGETASI